MSAGHLGNVRIESFRPVRPWVRPGEWLEVEVNVRSDAAGLAQVHLSLLDLDRRVASTAADIELAEGASSHRLAIAMPPTRRHGYGLRVELDADGSVVQATSAVEVLDGWWESPRHAAITDYREAQLTASATVALAAWHVNVVQHYDWMWRHYRYRPPDDAESFEDALGRFVSHAAVRASIGAGHDAGITSLAYGSVYGAEPEYVAEHPDERVFDEEGAPLSLGEHFFINDLRPGSAWRDRLLWEYRDAVTAFDFDGIHMDTYGPPHTAVAADGERIEFAELYPGLIGQAADLLRAVGPDKRVLFNCVEGFPLESVAGAPTAALYLELWPPDRELADVVDWIDRARVLAAGRQVVVAAYAATLKGEVAPADRAAAFEPVPLLGSVIAAAGAYHHTLAESDRLLVEGYYPAAVPMDQAERAELQALWRFTARYLHLLSDPAVEVVEPAGLELWGARGAVVAWSTSPSPGAVWVRTARAADGEQVLHLVDLRDQPDARWGAPKTPARDQVGLRLTWEAGKRLVAASPWTAAGAVEPLARDGDAWRLPAFRRWLMLVEP